MGEFTYFYEKINATAIHTSNSMKTFRLLLSGLIFFLSVSVSATGWLTLNGPNGYFSPQSVFYHQGAWYISSNTNSSTGTGIWKSVSNGFSWTDVSGGLPMPYCRDFGALGVDLFVACDTGIYRTSNGGSSWSAADNGLPDYTSVYELETHNNSLFACVFYGTGNVELFSLASAGSSWTSTGYIFPFSMTPNMLFSNGNNLWAATAAGLYKSTDNGVTFNYAGNNIPFNASVGSIVAHGDTAYCGTSNGSYFTTDGGALWMPITIPVLGSTIYTYSWKISGSTVFAGITNGGVYSTPLGQTNFNPLGTGYITNNLAWELATDGNYLFAATAEGIYSCLTSGGAWQQQNANILRARTRMAYADYQVIFAGSGAYTGLYRSLNGGSTWTLTSLQNQFRLFGRGLRYHNRILLPSSSGIHITDDLGSTFSSPASPPLPNYDVKTYGNILIACGGSNVLQSSDSGNTWTILGSGIPSQLTVYCLHVYGSKIYAGTNNGIYRFDPLTMLWSNYSQGLTGTLIVNDIESTGLTLFASTYQGVYRRSPSDSLWKPTGTTTLFNDFIAVDDILFGAGIDGISCSDDGGRTFRPYNDDLPPYAGEAESLFGYSHTLYAGMREYSGWKRGIERPIMIQGFYPNNYCAGDSINVSLLNMTPVNPGNKYILQLSDAYGDFFNAIAIDSVASTAQSVTLKLRIPPTTLAGTNYRFRAISTSPYYFTQPYEMPFTIRQGPSIQLQPANQTTCSGNSTGFYTGVSGTDFTYQWQVDISGSGNFTNISNNTLYQGVDSSSLSISSASLSISGYKYRCVISHPCTTLTTSSAVLTVDNLTPIIVQPVNDTICTGGSLQFNVVAGGLGNTYQWQRDGGAGFFNVSSSGGQFSGFNTPTLTLNFTLANDAGSHFRCVINGCTYSDTAQAVLSGVPAVYNLPSAYPYCAGADLNLQVQIAGTGLSYQWEEDAGSGFLPVSNGGLYQGATTSSLLLTGVGALYNGYQYRCKITGTCTPDSAYSTTTQLQLQSSPAITQQPVTTTVCEGDTAFFTAGGTGTFLNYFWEMNTGSGWLPVPVFGNYFSGVTTPSLTVANTESVLNGLQFRCNLSGCVQTQAATLQINAVPVVTAPPILWCNLTSNLPLNQATPPGGTYYGNNIVDNYFVHDFYPFIQSPYDYVYTAPNGCTASAGNIIIVVNCGATGEITDRLIELMLYPNPASSEVTLKFNGPNNDPVTISLFGIDGRLEKTRSGISIDSEIMMDIQDLPEGLYLVHVRSGADLMTQKLLILH